MGCSNVNRRVEPPTFGAVRGDSLPTLRHHTNKTDKSTNELRREEARIGHHEVADP